MDKKYIYRKHLREPSKYLGALFLFFLIVYIIFSLAIFFSNRVTVEEIIILLIGGIAVILIVGLEYIILYFTVFKRFKIINVSLTEEGIVYKNLKKDIRIKYSDIIKLKFPSIKYTGGWIKIVYNGGSIRLTVVLENIGDFLKSLKEKLDEEDMGHVYNEKAMYNFYKTAEFSDQSWARLYEYSKKIAIFILCNIFIAFIAIIIKSNLEYTIILFAISIMCPLITFIIAEIIIGRVIAKKAKREEFFVPHRDKLYELKVYKLAFGIYSIIYLIMLALMALR